MLFIEYPKCSTCQKAKKWLLEREVAFVDRNIKEDRPSAEEIKKKKKKSGLDIKRFFNTSGVVYKEMKMKDRLPQSTWEEKYQRLATDGMLVKRPLLITEQGAFPGFREEEWESMINR